MIKKVKDVLDFTVNEHALNLAINDDLFYK